MAEEIKAKDAAKVKARKAVFVRADEGVLRFEVLWDAVQAVFHKHVRGGFEKLETGNAVLKRLRVISRAAPEEACLRCGRPANEYNRELELDEQYVVLFPTAEYNFLKALVEDTEILWLHHRAIAAEETIRWLRAWPEVEVGEAELKA